MARTVLLQPVQSAGGAVDAFFGYGTSFWEVDGVCECVVVALQLEVGEGAVQLDSFDFFVCCRAMECFCVAESGECGQ